MNRLRLAAGAAGGMREKCPILEIAVRKWTTIHTKQGHFH